MSFVSYAQNFEDLILWRALKDISRGNYIDVGTQGPTADSVSRAFHDLGWRGAHVEALSFYADQIREARPGDLVINAAVTDNGDSIKFFEIKDTGLSTASEKIAKEHADAGFDVSEVVVPCITLDEVILRSGFQDIHWLKIDVEGHEKNLLNGWNCDVRPWILAIESMYPNRQVETKDEWESIIIQKDYKYIYTDGLNRFYIHRDHIDLADKFIYPPNVFDNFSVTQQHWIARTAVQEATESAHQAQDAQRLAELELAHNAYAELQDAHAKQIELLGSEIEQARSEALRFAESADQAKAAQHLALAACEQREAELQAQQIAEATRHANELAAIKDAQSLQERAYAEEIRQLHTNAQADIKAAAQREAELQAQQIAEATRHADELAAVTNALSLQEKAYAEEIKHLHTSAQADIKAAAQREAELQAQQIAEATRHANELVAVTNALSLQERTYAEEIKHLHNSAQADIKAAAQREAELQAQQIAEAARHADELAAVTNALSLQEKAYAEEIKHLQNGAKAEIKAAAQREAELRAQQIAWAARHADELAAVTNALSLQERTYAEEIKRLHSSAQADIKAAAQREAELQAQQIAEAKAFGENLMAVQQSHEAGYRHLADTAMARENELKKNIIEIEEIYSSKISKITDDFSHERQHLSNLIDAEISKFTSFEAELCRLKNQISWRIAAPIRYLEDKASGLFKIK